MKVFEKLLYLDRDFISALYESETGYAPETKITKTEGLNASAKIPLVSAGVSSVESKSYAISTVGMLSELQESINKYPKFSDIGYSFGNSSCICWAEGILSIDKVELKRSRSTMTIVGKPKANPDDFKDKLIAEEYYFSLKSDEDKFALLPTPDYFSSGVSAFQELANTVVGPIELPVKTLIRVYSAQTSFKQWFLLVPIVPDCSFPSSPMGMHISTQ